MSFSSSFLTESIEIIKNLDCDELEKIVDAIVKIRDDNGRLFIVGSGGGAGHASHAVCDFRKLCNVEAYSPYDNASELTARVNDEGWESTIINWLKISKLNSIDGLFVFSVGGGSEIKNISTNLVNAIRYAAEVGAKIFGIVGKDGGYTKEIGNAVIVIPPMYENRITPHTEGLQAILWHAIVSHPRLQSNPMKWESTQ